MGHELKVWSEFFGALLSGEKTFELRRDDRGFHAGDVLWLREWNERTKEYTGRDLRRKVTYLLGGWGLEKDYVCMALESPLALQLDIERQGAVEQGRVIAQLRQGIAELCKAGDRFLVALRADQDEATRETYDEVADAKLALAGAMQRYKSEATQDATN